MVFLALLPFFDCGGGFLRGVTITFSAKESNSGEEREGRGGGRKATAGKRGRGGGQEEGVCVDGKGTGTSGPKPRNTRHTIDSRQPKGQACAWAAVARRQSPSHAPAQTHPASPQTPPTHATHTRSTHHIGTWTHKHTSNQELPKEHREATKNKARARGAGQLHPGVCHYTTHSTSKHHDHRRASRRGWVGPQAAPRGGVTSPGAPCSRPAPLP